MSFALKKNNKFNRHVSQKREKWFKELNCIKEP